MGPGSLFLVARTTETKFRRSTGVTTANSTNKNPIANKLSWVINYSMVELYCKSTVVWVLQYGCLVVWVPQAGAGEIHQIGAERHCTAWHVYYKTWTGQAPNGKPRTLN